MRTRGLVLIGCGVALLGVAIGLSVPPITYEPGHLVTHLLLAGLVIGAGAWIVLAARNPHRAPRRQLPAYGVGLLATCLLASSPVILLAFLAGPYEPYTLGLQVSWYVGYGAGFYCVLVDVQDLGLSTLDRWRARRSDPRSNG